MLTKAIKLPWFKTIDTNLGLKYLNGNRELYLKILNNFLNRYGDLNIEHLNEEELNNLLHSIKGLSATLGMVGLSKVIEVVYDAPNKQNLLDLEIELTKVLDELKSSDLIPNSKQKRVVVLILNDNPEEIAELIESLDDRYDLLVALDYEGVVEIVENEDVDQILMSKGVEDEVKSLIYALLKKSNNLKQIEVVFNLKELNRVL